MAVMCVLQVMDFLLVVVRLHLIMSGDVELNPGPLDGGWNTRVHICVCVGMYNVHIWYKRGGRIPINIHNPSLISWNNVHTHSHIKLLTMYSVHGMLILNSLQYIVKIAY